MKNSLKIMLVPLIALIILALIATPVYAEYYLNFGSHAACFTCESQRVYHHPAYRQAPKKHYVKKVPTVTHYRTHHVYHAKHRYHLSPVIQDHCYNYNRDLATGDDIYPEMNIDN